MINKLNINDITELKYEIIKGVLLSYLFCIIATGTFVPLANRIITPIGDPFSMTVAVYTGVLCFSIATFAMIKLNRKLFLDIRNGVKDSEIKIVAKKEYKKDYEAGSGIVGSWCKSMNAFDVYSIIVDNYLYRVNAEFYQNCKNGDKVVFNFAPRSRHLLSIDLMDKPV